MWPKFHWGRVAPKVHEGCKQSHKCPLSLPGLMWLLSPAWALLAACPSSRHATMQSLCGRTPCGLGDEPCRYAPSPATPHLQNKTSGGAGEKKLREALPQGCWDLTGDGRHQDKIKSGLSNEIQLPKISPKCQAGKTCMASSPLCDSLVVLLCIICSSVLSSLAKA